MKEADFYSLILPVHIKCWHRLQKHMINSQYQQAPYLVQR